MSDTSAASCDSCRREGINLKRKVADWLNCELARGAVCKDDEEIDFTKIENWFRASYYHVMREASYKTLKPKVIVEAPIFNDAIPRW